LNVTIGTQDVHVKEISWSAVDLVSDVVKMRRLWRLG